MSDSFRLHRCDLSRASLCAAEMRKAGQLTEEGSNGAIGASTAPLWQQSTKEYGLSRLNSVHALLTIAHVDDGVTCKVRWARRVCRSAS